jgi:hypothetical protein
MYPLATAPIIAPMVRIDPKTEYCRLLNGDEKPRTAMAQLHEHELMLWVKNRFAYAVAHAPGRG